MKIFGEDAVAVGMTLAIAAVAGFAAWSLHLPLGFMLGALVSVGTIAAVGRRVAGYRMTMPLALRNLAVPVIGVSIGGAFTPEVVAGVAEWWVSLLAVLVFIPAAHGLAYAIFRAGGIPRIEAFFGGVPGGLIESVHMGEEMGADIRILTALQFLRLIVTIIAIPLIFLALTGDAVGSAAGAVMGGSTHLGPVDIVVLAAAGVLGVIVARRLNFPAAMMTGPLLLSALTHAVGLAHGAPPGWMIAATQVIIGASLGAQFEGIERRVLVRCLGLSLVNGAAALILAWVFAGLLVQVVDEPMTAIFIAFAPGGVAEMSLIALSLNIGVVYVTAHHLVRIVLSVLIARKGSRLLR